MKLALVSQPFDTILPPHQNSVGACTYGLAAPLAQFHDVVIYGPSDGSSGCEHRLTGNLRLKRIPLTAKDRLAFKLRKTLAAAHQLWSPASTSSLLFPDFGQAVAADLRAERCDVIHVQHCSQYVPVIRRLNPRAKIVLHLHAEWFSQSDSATLRKRIRDADLITSVSDYVTDKVKRAFPEFASRCETTYNGVDPDEFSQAKDYSSLRTRPVKQLLYAGGISPHKGLHVLLDAFRRINERFPDTQLLVSGPSGTYPVEENFDRIADKRLIDELRPFYPNPTVLRACRQVRGAHSGPTEYQLALKRLLSGGLADRVKFLGGVPRPELIRHYFESDVFIFPPVWNEGFGIPPVEAMAAGTPVVASRSGAVVETVQDGVTGYLVERSDPAGLADAVISLLSDTQRAEAMGRAARTRALEMFNWERVASGVAARYESLAVRDDSSSLLAPQLATLSSR